MPFPFVLPTTSSFAFSSSFTSNTHPSLPLNASTHRGVVRDTLKKHKRLPPSSQSAHVSTVVSNLNAYVPYLLAVDGGLASARRPDGSGSATPSLSAAGVSVTQRAPLAIEWRPTLSDSALPGREVARVRVSALEWEVGFVLSSLANAYTHVARSALHPLYVTSASAAVGTQARTSAITTATKYLLDAASIYGYLAARSENPDVVVPPPCPDVSPSAVRALGSLAHAEATLLAVLKDDPYPAVVAQDRNQNDREWMYKAPDIPKVRAHLFARLCIAASEHAAKAYSLLLAAADSGSSSSRQVIVGGVGVGVGNSGGGGKINDILIRYVEDLRRTSRAKACRFFGIDAELGGKTGEALAWLRAGLQELGVEVKADGRKSSGFGRLKKEWTEKREDRKVEKETSWGADGGKLEETRVIEMLEAKWTKQNDTMFTQTIPPIGPLLAQMPSGREIHTIKPYQVPVLERYVLDAMRAPPDRADDATGGDLSSDEDSGRAPAQRTVIVGAYPDAGGEYSDSGPAGGDGGGSFRSESTSTYY